MRIAAHLVDKTRRKGAAHKRAIVAASFAPGGYRSSGGAPPGRFVSPWAAIVAEHRPRP
jgi:hypothetical protein